MNFIQAFFTNPVVVKYGTWTLLIAFCIANGIADSRTDGTEKDPREIKRKRRGVRWRYDKGSTENKEKSKED